MSDFNTKVIELLKKIPKGKVTTYKIIAETLGTKAYRAVGTAVKRNKKPIVLPCHRVVNSNGHIGNYSGPKGIKGKIELLTKEGIAIKHGKIENFKNVIYKF